MTPFDFVNSINSSAKKDILAESEASETDYVPFVSNKTFSYFPETILFANQMNQLHYLDKKLQYHYLLNTVRPGKRFTKWLKQGGVEDLDAVKEFYGYNTTKARTALSILSSQQIHYIKQKLQRGGNDDKFRKSTRSEVDDR